MEKKFKWTIEDISILKPADIDESTISQHVHHTDPHIESMVQQTIDNFFNEKVIVPSPMNLGAPPNIVPLIKLQDCSIVHDDERVSPEENAELKTKNKQYSDGICQTVLSLPLQLPKEVEDALKPFFTYTQDQQQAESFGNETSLYKRLFEFDHDDHDHDNTKLAENHEDDDPHGSYVSSPAISTGYSPIQLSPFVGKVMPSPSSEIPELNKCLISPIPKKSPVRLSRSACRLDFSSKMSVDNSLVMVPDVDNQEMSVLCVNDESLSSPRPTEISTNKSENWSMEYHHVSLLTNDSDSEKMDVSNSNTPQSKIFTSQRKRLSDSFQLEETNEEFLSQNKENITLSGEVTLQGRNKIFRNDDNTDLGYQTQSHIGDESNFGLHVFASTPSKRKSYVDQKLV